MSTNKIIASIESDDFDFDDTTAMDSTPFYSADIDQAHKTSKFHKSTSLARFVRTWKINSWTGVHCKREITPRKRRKTMKVK